MSGPAYVIADWGATGRGEETAGSDRDLIVWAPEAAPDDWERIRVTLEESALGAGTYLDALIYDGTRSLREWALSSATDLQAILFASNLRGDTDLVAEFATRQDELWSDHEIRAREVWLLSAEVIQRPRIMQAADAMFRPEKFMPGATRSFSALGELWGMIEGWKGPLPTTTALAAIERRFELGDGELTQLNRRSVQIRTRVEGGEHPRRFVHEWRSLANTALRTQSMLMAASGDWLQRHAGIPLALAGEHFAALEAELPPSFPAATSLEPTTTRMMTAFYSDQRVLESLVRESGHEWHVAFAATANLNANSLTLDTLVKPISMVSPTDYRNVWLWALRHPNVGLATVQRFLSEPGHRSMDYDAALGAEARLSRPKSGKNSGKDVTPPGAA